MDMEEEINIIKLAGAMGKKQRAWATAKWKWLLGNGLKAMTISKKKGT